jgi:hypothetical protein
MGVLVFIKSCFSGASLHSIALSRDMISSLSGGLAEGRKKYFGNCEAAADKG